MINNNKRIVRLNSLTGPRVKAPAVSPDTLRELCDPFSGFFQIYCLESGKARWHGHLKNIGMQYTIPFTVILPPQVTEMLGLNNDDQVRLFQSDLSEARTVYYRQMPADTNPDFELPELMLGSELIETNLDFTYQGTHICLMEWVPESSFIGPGTQILETDSNNPVDFIPENNVEEVFTDDVIVHELQSSETNNENNQNKEEK